MAGLPSAFAQFLAPIWAILFLCPIVLLIYLSKFQAVADTVLDNLKKKFETAMKWIEDNDEPFPGRVEPNQEHDPELAEYVKAHEYVHQALGNYKAGHAFLDHEWSKMCYTPSPR